ncbi:MAG: hypothetical protein IT444_00465 [Phycisphaeraceae bacterium]|nr:hypothetical protein [Phycisphaeraceae bacterium]
MMRIASSVLLVVVLFTLPAFARGLDGGDQLLPRLPQPKIKPGDMGLRGSRDADQGDRIGKITQAMDAVVTDLSKEQTDKLVQDRQNKIIKDLDSIIRELEKQTGGGGGGKGSGGGKGMSPANPNSPMRDSNIASGPGGIGDLHAPKASRKNWAELSPKQRERILQATSEGFPPGFEAVLQSYYRRLAQEQVERDESATTQPSVP